MLVRRRAFDADVLASGKCPSPRAGTVPFAVTASVRIPNTDLSSTANFPLPLDSHIRPWNKAGCMTGGEARPDGDSFQRIARELIRLQEADLP